MARPLRTPFGVAVAALGIIALAPLGAAGQTQTTGWGDPDIQGVWEYWTFTPLERSDEFAGRETLTAEEAAGVAAAGHAAAVAQDENDPAPGDPGTYAQDVWTERSRQTALTQSSLIVDPPDGRLPAVTAAERARAAAHAASGSRPVRVRAGGIGADGPEDRGLSERCLLSFSTGPPLLPAGYNNNLQILQTPTHVALVVEMIHDVRIVRLNDAVPLDADVQQWLGSSSGYWDDDTLVVETTNFTDKVGSFSTTRDAWGTGEHLTLTERFTRTDDRTLTYEWTVDNPTVFTQTFTGRMPMNLSDQPLYEYACHEGNYGMYNSLTGSRAEERAAGTNTRAADLLRVTPAWETLLGTANNEGNPSLSPDGRWIAYRSDDSGSAQVYVAPFPSMEGRQRVSVGGGHSPTWSSDGQRLFYQTPTAMMVVAVDAGESLTLGAPTVLFEGDYVDDFSRAYDMTDDGRFLMMKPADSAQGPDAEINVVLNWHDELLERVPVP